MSPRGASAVSGARVTVTTPTTLESEAAQSPFILKSELHHRLLAWISPTEDHIGGWFYPRNTPEGLAAHLTDDCATTNPVRIRETGEALSDDGTYTPEIVATLLDDLENAGLVTCRDGKWERTAAGNKALGGIVYADHPDLADDPAHAAFFAEPTPKRGPR